MANCVPMQTAGTADRARRRSFFEKAKGVAARGYTALKFDPFGSTWRTMSRNDFDLSLDIITAVRDAVGPSVDLLIEGHCRFNTSTAIEFSEAMHHLRPVWFEEPVPHTNTSAMVEVARRSPVPVATGESLSNKQQFAELLKYDVVTFLQPEPLNLGGIFAARKIADMADAHFGMIAPHSAQGPVCRPPACNSMPPFRTSLSTKSSMSSTSRGKRIS